jgi:hypothetical protein
MTNLLHSCEAKLGMYLDELCRDLTFGSTQPTRMYGFQVEQAALSTTGLQVVSELAEWVAQGRGATGQHCIRAKPIRRRPKLFDRYSAGSFFADYQHFHLVCKAYNTAELNSENCAHGSSGSNVPLYPYVFSSPPCLVAKGTYCKLAVHLLL